MYSHFLKFLFLFAMIVALAVYAQAGPFQAVADAASNAGEDAEQTATDAARDAGTIVGANDGTTV